ncbi:MAG: hypothetical protein ACYC4R_06210 [Anaerolineae bacterium]
MTHRVDQPLFGVDHSVRRHVPTLACAVLACAVLAAALLGAGCRRRESFDSRLGAIVKPYRFSMLRWHAVNLLAPETTSSIIPEPTSPEAAELVRDYYALVDQSRAVRGRLSAVSAVEGLDAVAGIQQELDGLQTLKDRVRPVVERILAGQIRSVMRSEGIYNPADRLVTWHVSFPPIYFRLAQPPHLLVISPRDRIESYREILLLQNLTVAQMVAIEQAVEELGVSALVVPLGGFGAAYPAFVADDASLTYAMSTITEEWLHQYLAFTPLGFRYVLDLTGVAPNYEVARLNETVADMVSDELAQQVLRAYYPDLVPPESISEGEAGASGFCFDCEMRAIRLQVDAYLANGQVEEAERYMEEQRLYLASQGSYLRRLNQAYFAFHGTYAAQPGSVDPIGQEMRALRSRSGSVSAFLNVAAGIESREELQGALEVKPQP